MGIIELIILAVGLSLDAFAVSVGKGLATKDVKIKHMCLCGAWFGIFQALMPCIGYLLGSLAEDFVDKYDHWIAFILLGLIGGNMIREAVNGNEDDGTSTFRPFEMFLMALATSIDALIAGVSFAFVDINIVAAAITIGCTTFIFSFAGVKIGSIFGSKFEKKAEILGGVILIALGVKALLSGLGVIA